MDMQRSLNTISKWGKFLGYLFIVCGALTGLGGLFFFIIGAIPGVVQIFLGVFLLRSAKEAEALLRQYDETSLATMLDNYAKYLKLTGIFMLIYIILTVVILLFTFTGAIIFGDLIDSMNYL